MKYSRHILTWNSRTIVLRMSASDFDLVYEKEMIARPTTFNAIFLQSDKVRDVSQARVLDLAILSSVRKDTAFVLMTQPCHRQAFPRTTSDRDYSYSDRGIVQSMQHDAESALVGRSSKRSAIYLLKYLAHDCSRAHSDPSTPQRTFISQMSSWR